MADNRPRANDADEETPSAKSAEDRKAASALANLDASHDDAAVSKHVDRRAVDEAMKRLGGGAMASSSSAAAAAAAAASTSAAKAKAAAAPVKNVKVDAADVALIVDQLELSRPRATELLKAHDGDAVKAMRAYIAV